MHPRTAAETSPGENVLDLRTRDARQLLTATGLAIVLAVSVAWPVLRGIDHRFISFSDGVYTYIASVVANRGAEELYGAIVLSQPPGLVLGAAALWKLSPHIETIRIALAVLSALTALLTYSLAQTLGLRAAAATAAALIALTAPIHAQFAGLDGEAVLTPLALGLALTLERRRIAAAGVLLGLGLFFKLTWAPFLLAGAFALGRREGAHALRRAGTGGLATLVALYGAALAIYGWSPRDLLTEIVFAQSYSGFQLSLVPAIVIGVLLLWWPMLVLAPAGRTVASRSIRLLVAAGVLSFAFTLKEGTFFNVLDPLEPFLAILAVAGAIELWRRRRFVPRGIAAVCAAGVALHAVSVSGGGLAGTIPFPVGAAFVDTDNQMIVDRAAQAIATHSRPDERVLVNPLLALVAGRREVGDQADWFILRSMERYCRAKGLLAERCDLWSRMKAGVRRGATPVISVDTNVVSFDESFRSDTKVRSMRLVLRERRPPISIDVYVRKSARPIRSLSG